MLSIISGSSMTKTAIAAAIAAVFSVAAEAQQITRPFNGGTGISQANTKTITLGGALVTSGANTLTITTTGNTNVTLPLTGTLLTTTGSGAGLTAVNAATLGGATFAAPGPIGSVTSSTGAFTSLTASTLTVSNLAIGRIPLASTGGLLITDNAFTYNSSSTLKSIVIDGSASSIVTLDLINTHATGSVFLSLATAGTGDVQTIYSNTGTTWYSGIDTSTAKQYVIGVGVGDWLRITTAGATSLLGSLNVVGNTRIGSTVAPTVPLDVTGNMIVSGTSVIGGASYLVGGATITSQVADAMAFTVTNRSTDDAGIFRFTNYGITAMQAQIISWSTGILDIYTGSTNTKQVSILNAANATRNLTLSGSNGGNPAISVSGGELALGTNVWTLGTANVVTPTAPNRTLTVTIGGTTYYIAAKTTND